MYKLDFFLTQPSFGGVGKYGLIREIDALGGLMGKCIDNSFIHHRLINKKKGKAVQSHRFQVDRDIYQKNMQNEISKIKNLKILEGQ